jgi:hypothetical protein
MDEVADLAARLDGLVFADLTTDQVTARIIDEVVAWGAGTVGGSTGGRERRSAAAAAGTAALGARRGVARRTGPRWPSRSTTPTGAGRSRSCSRKRRPAASDLGALGAGPIAVPPLPVRMVPLQVTRHGHTYSRRPDRPPPPHGSAVIGAAAEPIPLPTVPRMERLTTPVRPHADAGP